MPSEKRIVRTLELLTTTPLASLAAERQEAVRQVRQLLATGNLVGLGVGDKISAAQGATGKLALIFYVERKRDSRKLKGHETVPPVVPAALTGGRPILTDVVQLGRLRSSRGRKAAPPDGVRPKRGMLVLLEGKGKIGLVRDVHFRLLTSYDGTGDVAFRQQGLATAYTFSARAGTTVLDRRSGRPVGRHFAATAEGCLFDPSGQPVTGKIPALDTRAR